MLGSTGQNLANGLRAALDRLRGTATRVAETTAPDPADASSGWPRVRALDAAWRARASVDEVGELLVGELQPRPSGVAALDLLHAIGPARVPAALSVVEARLAEEAPMGHGTVEEDEAWLASLRRAREAILAGGG